MVNEHSEGEQSPHRPDQHRRHADNPSIPITLSLSRHLKERLDAYARERKSTRNGVISQALTAWLDTHGTPEEA